jgi:D-amino-acid dehydrogenase
MPRLPVMDAEAKFAATPMEEGLRFAGTVELAGLAAPPDWRRARRLYELGRRLFPALTDDDPGDRLSLWMGHRPSTPDSLPVIGRSRRSADVLYAFGHGHVGMAASPVTGRLIAELVDGRPPGFDLAPYRADRFG